MRKAIAYVSAVIALMILVGGLASRVETQPSYLMLGQNSGTVKAVAVDANGNLTIGAAATAIGKNEDAAASSGDTGTSVLAVRKDTSAQLTSADADYSWLTTDAYGAQFVRQDSNNRILCRLTTTATTSTAITGCAAPGAGLSIYITDINIMGGVANAATAAASIQYGTGGTCGTGTTVVFDCQHAATSGCTANLSTPIKAAANSEVCLLDAAVGTKFAAISGFIAP